MRPRSGHQENNKIAKSVEMDRGLENDTGRRLTPEERALRVKKLKRKRQIRLALVVTAFILVIVLIICPIILFAAVRVRKFDLEGTSPYTPDEITEKSGVTVGKSMLFMDTEEIEKTIETNLPYTDDVKVTKKLPGTLVIRYGEAVKRFAIRVSDSTFAICSDGFKMLETTGVMPEGVIRVLGVPPVTANPGDIVSFVKDKAELDENGEPVGDATLSLLLKISKSIDENGIEDINLIDLSSPSHIYLIYNERIVLNLGDSTGIERKLALGKKVIDSENENSLLQTGVINLTVEKQAYFNADSYKDIPELIAYFNLDKPPEEIEPEEDENAENTDGENEEVAESDEESPDDAEMDEKPQEDESAEEQNKDEENTDSEDENNENEEE